MYRSAKLISTILFSLGITYTSQAQTLTFDDRTVDSLTFVQTRNVINTLPNSMFQKKVYTEGDKQLPYRLLLPKDYDQGKKYPLILTLHNSSRIGNDNEGQLEHLTKTWIREDIYSTYQAFVIAPQFSERSSIYSRNNDGLTVSQPYPDIGLVLNLLTQFQKEYRIDPSRIYLVGYSMGASTAQNLINLAPKRFAAIASVAAVPDISHLDKWKNKPIYLIHGKKDIDNPYEGSVALFERLKGNKKAIFKTYNELHHGNITIPLLLNDNLANWLFKQRR